MERVLIVGNGYAGLAAARILAARKGFKVTMAAAEGCPAYVPHLLPGIAAGKTDLSETFLSRSEEYAEMKIDFRAGARVEKLSPVKRTALLSDGETVTFDKALVASGAAPHVPASLSGSLGRCANVLAFKLLGDAVALRRLISDGASRIVIVGAGRVGMLLAEALKEADVSVSIVEIGPQILATMLEPDMAARLHPLLRRRSRLRIHNGVGVESIVHDSGIAREIRLSDGTVLPCDAMVIATGVAPNTGFIEDGPADGEGIRVTERMETSTPGIHAAGDVVTFETMTGRMDVGQLAQNARQQGEVAALNIAGEKAACPPSFIGNVVKVDPLIAARIGDIDGDERADFRIGTSAARATMEGGTVIGIQFVGDPDGLRGLVPAVLKKFPREDLSDLFRGRLDMGLAPLLAAGSYSWV